MAIAILPISHISKIKVVKVGSIEPDRQTSIIIYIYIRGPIIDSTKNTLYYGSFQYSSTFVP